jgi:molecular chaperone DnaK
MRQEAKLFAEEDQLRIRLVEIKNQADGLIYSYESTLEENGSVLAESVKAEADRRCLQLKTLMNATGTTVEGLQGALDSFQEILFEIGSSVYGKSGSGTSPQPDLGVSGLDGGQVFEEDATVTADYEAVE